MSNKLNKLLHPLILFAEIQKRLVSAHSKILHKKNMQFLSQYEKRPLKYQPIFIIGPPRCGSTLLYQVMVHRFKFAYLQNRMVLRKYSIPLYTSKYIDRNESYHSDFVSHHGRTKQPNAPHEGYLFWRRFYPRKVHDYVTQNELSLQQIFEIRNTIKFLTNFYNAPFLSKNMEIGLRLNSIQEIFPDAIYIVVKRDPRATASSLLNARLADYNSKDVWWSIRPKEYE